MNDMIDLGRYVRAVVRRWPVVLALVVIGVLAGYTVSQVLPPVYQAGTTLLVTTPKLTASFDARLRSTLELGLNRELQRTLYNLIPNRALEARVVEKLGEALPSPQRVPGALLEHTGVYEHLSAEDNLEFYARAWRLPAAERKARIQELLTHMGLWERRKNPAGKWSRGMKQKLALARALLHRPPLVLLDEPTAGLDVPSATAVREDLAALAAREGVTVFLTTHNMAEAEKLCRQVAVIRAGKLVAVGHPDELRARAGGPHIEVVGEGFSQQGLALLRAQPEVMATEVQNGRLTIDLRHETPTAPLVSLLVKAGVQVEEVRRGQASLEEVFMTLMEEEK